MNTIRFPRRVIGIEESKQMTYPERLRIFDEDHELNRQRYEVRERGAALRVKPFVPFTFPILRAETFKSENSESGEQIQ